MRENTALDNIPNVGDGLRTAAKVTSFGGLFISLTGTGLISAGSDSFNCPPILWKISLGINFLAFGLAWIAYIPFRNTDKALGTGLLAAFGLFNLFWLVGIAGFYFYFIYAPINIWTRVIAIASVTTALLHRAYVIYCDIRIAVEGRQKLLHRMYREEAGHIVLRRSSIALLEKSRKDRNPFRPIHAYAAILVMPFIFVLNRVFTPLLGDGHGVFLVLAFFSIPILLWGVEIFIQTIMTMIFYPLKVQKETGRSVLLKDC